VKRLAIFAALILSAAAGAAQADLRISGLFSNLHYSEESGDLGGWEILVIPSGESTYTAFVQLAEGQGPTVAVGTLLAKGGRFTLTIPPGSVLAGTYKGVISAKDMRLETPAGPETLLRGKSYWQ
jgi:hypothetical protein